MLNAHLKDRPITDEIVQLGFGSIQYYNGVVYRKMRIIHMISGQFYHIHVEADALYRCSWASGLGRTSGCPGQEG